MLVRAARKRCPLCGTKGQFTRWTRLRDTRPGCGYRFERESGYWVGAIIINLAVTEVLFGIMFITTLLVTAPEVPWQPLLAVPLATNGIIRGSSIRCRRRSGWPSISISIVLRTHAQAELVSTSVDVGSYMSRLDGLSAPLGYPVVVQAEQLDDLLHVTVLDDELANPPGVGQRLVNGGCAGLY